MFCPKCGQPQVADDVRFCSGCGFALNIVTEVLAGGGRLNWRPPEEATPRGLSPRQKGIRQGAMLMLSTFLIVPIVIFLGVATLHLPGQLIPLAAVICIFGGLLRILYAAMFEESVAQSAQPSFPSYAPPSPPNYLGTPSQNSALPPPRAAPAPTYRPRYNTGELVERPSSVTENTTRLLDKQPTDPSERQP